MPDPIPAMLLGRLAVDEKWQGQRIGPGMLKDAALRSVAASELAGLRALFVHALSDEAKKFYLKYGFRASPLDPMTLMVPLEEILRSVK